MDKNGKRANSEYIYDALRLISQGISIYKAAIIYNITRSTLWRRLKNTHKDKPVKNSFDRKGRENIIEICIIRCQYGLPSNGYMVTINGRADRSEKVNIIQIIW